MLDDCTNVMIFDRRPGRDENEYLEWIQRNFNSGYVANAFRPNTAGRITGHIWLHTASCGDIRTRGNHTGPYVFKACSTSLEDLTLCVQTWQGPDPEQHKCILR